MKSAKRPRRSSLSKRKGNNVNQKLFAGMFAPNLFAEPLQHKITRPFRCMFHGVLIKGMVHRLISKTESGYAVFASIDGSEYRFALIDLSNGVLSGRIDSTANRTLAWVPFVSASPNPVHATAVTAFEFQLTRLLSYHLRARQKQPITADFFP